MRPVVHQVATEVTGQLVAQQASLLGQHQAAQRALNQSRAWLIDASHSASFWAKACGSFMRTSSVFPFAATDAGTTGK